MRFKRSKPEKLVIGPGIRGTKLPMSPKKHRIIPIITKKISINFFKITKYKSEFL